MTDVRDTELLVAANNNNDNNEILVKILIEGMKLQLKVNLHKNDKFVLSKTDRFLIQVLVILHSILFSRR